MKGLPQERMGRGQGRARRPGARHRRRRRPASALAVALDSDLLRALAYTGFLLNLFNLIPVLPLDGGRAAAAVHPAFWFVGLFAVALLFFMHGSTILLLIAGSADTSCTTAGSAGTTPTSRPTTMSPAAQRIAVSVVYLGLIVVLVAGMDASYIHRTL